MKLQNNINEYIRQIQEQCKKYASKHYYPVRAGRDDITYEDVTQEMLKIAWQSYRNGNGLSKVILEKKLIPRWQLDLIFQNALRNLKITDIPDTESAPEPAKVVLDENGEVIDFYYPNIPDPLRQDEEESIINSMSLAEKQKWLEEIQRLKKLGYSDTEIISMLTPAAQAQKRNQKENLISNISKQEVLF